MNNLVGFTFIRNGVKYDYPFIESIQTLKQVCNEVYVAIGQSEDKTLEEVRKIEKVKITETKWDETLREGGKIFSEQTNFILSKVEGDYSKGSDTWGLYLQCDEVIHERDFLRLKQDLELATKRGCDAVCFRYLHFWQSYDQVAIAWNWYPQEIRAIKLHQGIKSYGDAQSFKGAQNIFHSDVIIYHYGHVREKDAYLNKMNNFVELYHHNNKRKLKKAKSRIIYKTKTHPYLGPHPAVMKKRMESFPPRKSVERLCIIGHPSSISSDFLGRIKAKKIEFYKRSYQVPNKDQAICVMLAPFGILDRVINYFSSLIGKTPLRKMNSPISRPFPQELFLTLLLATKGVGVE